MDQKYLLDEVFIHNKRNQRLFCIVAVMWSNNLNDWLYTVHYSDNNTFRRYTQLSIDFECQFVGYRNHDIWPIDAKAIEYHTNQTANAETALQAAFEPLNRNNPPPIVNTTDNTEAKPERLAKVYPILKLCSDKYGYNSERYSRMLQYHEYILMLNKGKQSA